MIGGQFRLAGMQPRRAQILDLMEWYERQFEKLGVTLRLNTYLDADEIAAHPADTVVLATGSLPDEKAFQRWLPHLESLPGLELGGVWSPEDVMRREARLGDAVIVYDEGSNWRGVGTAWALAEAGKQVTIVTPEAFVGKEIARTAADGAARRRMAKLGVVFKTEACIARWHGNGATSAEPVDRRGGGHCRLGLVMATTNRAFDPFPEDLRGQADARGSAIVWRRGLLPMRFTKAANWRCRFRPTRAKLLADDSAQASRKCGEDDGSASS